MAREIRELDVNYIRGDNFITISSTDFGWTKKIKNLAAKNPNECVIKHENEDGSIVAVFPVKYLKISKPRSSNLSDEKRAELAERMRRAKKND